MRIFTKEIFIPNKVDLSLDNLQHYYRTHLRSDLFNKHRVLRFVITKTIKNGYYCELDLLVPERRESIDGFQEEDIFTFRKRALEKTDKFTAVLLIPTGIGAEIGGHCGDGNAVARLIASGCDVLITHPNVVNASDINEMTENTLYVEGSAITRFLMGQIGLQVARSNRILMLMDRHREKFFNEEVVNAVSSARVTLGIDCDVYEMENKDMVLSKSSYSRSGRASGKIYHIERLFEIIKKYGSGYDAIGLSTFIKVPKHFHKKYFEDDDMVNPWGGIEAMLTHSITELFRMPCAHSPMMTSNQVRGIQKGVCDPRKAPESASVTYLHCVLKGLHRSPRLVGFDGGIALEDVSCLIIPDGCVGLPTLACLENNIPVIAVKENKNKMKNNLRDFPFQKGKLFIVDNYLEAVGVMASLKAGVSINSVRRPIAPTVQLN